MSKYIDAEKLIAKLRKHLIPTILDRDYDEWEKGKDAGFLQAIEIVESLQQEQLEVDLEKEITPSLVENMLCEFGVQSIDDMDSENLAEFARHFWNKGYNAGKG